MTVQQVSRETETRIRPFAASFAAGEIARRADPGGYAHGVGAGHEDAIAHLEPVIRTTWYRLQKVRGDRNRSHPELGARRAYDAAAAAIRLVLVDLFDVRRALKGDHR